AGTAAAPRGGEIREARPAVGVPFATGPATDHPRAGAGAVARATHTLPGLRGGHRTRSPPWWGPRASSRFTRLP
ncbi:hypothetical protein, partial [Streptomyces sp. SID8014]|uniref:hypothetical protein n=1 Tax=Streptomyces sp. SID8014 TaxID=2706097 RepID=UPI0019417E14